MKLTQWRKGRKDAVIALSFPDFCPVIPAKAGIQRFGNGVCALPLPLDSVLRQPQARYVNTP